MNPQPVGGFSITDPQRPFEYAAPGTIAEVVRDEAGALVPSRDLTLLFSPSGAYVGSYGIDPSTGAFSAWDAKGQEMSFSEMAAQLAKGAAPAPAGPSYDNSGRTVNQPVSQMTAFQITALGESVDDFSTTQIAQINPAALTGLNIGTVGGLSPEQLQAMTVQQLQALDAWQVAQFGSSQINALSSQQIQALNTTDISSSALSGLSENSVQSLTTAQVANLSADQLSELGTKVDYFSTAQLASIDPGSLSGLSSSAISALTPAQDVALAVPMAEEAAGPQSYAPPPPLNSATVTQGPAPSLTTEQISQMSAAQIAALGEEVDNFSPEQIAAINVNAIAGLSKESISFMTAEDAQAFSAEQLRAFSSAQVSALNSSQMNLMSTEQIQALNVTGLWYSPLAYLSKHVVQSFTDAQVASLSITQIGWLGNNADYFTPEQQLALAVPVAPALQQIDGD